MEEKIIMVCRRCGKEIDPNDRFCRSCGTPVRKEENKSGEKQPGYKDDIESTMGRFDGKYMLIAGVILGAVSYTHLDVYKRQTYMFLF